MPLKFTCTACKTKCQVAEEFAGRQVRCGNCSEVQTAPVPEPPVEEIPEVVLVEPITTAPLPPAHQPLFPRRLEGENDFVPRRPNGPRRDKQPAQHAGAKIALILVAVAGVGAFLFAGMVIAGIVVYWTVARQSRPPAGVAFSGKQRKDDSPAPEGQDAEAQRLEMARLEEAQRREEQARQAEERRKALAQQEEERRQARARFEELRRQVEAERRREQAEKAKEAAQAHLASLSKPLANVKIPPAQLGGNRLAQAWKPGNGLRWVKVNIGESPTGVCWAADGKSFFALTKDGTLRRVSYPDLKELRKVKFNQECVELAWCQRGLLITLAQLQELWIVDPETLGVVARFGVSQLSKAMTGPRLDVAYVQARPVKRFGSNGPVRVSLKDGKLDFMEVVHSKGLRWVGFRGNLRYAALSPNGKYLFAEAGNLIRYSIKGTILTADSFTRENMGGGHKAGICISPDGEWVCFPTGGGNGGLNYGTYLYRTSDLSRPAFTMRQGAYPEIVGYDPVSKRFFSQNYGIPLLVFDVNGTKRGGNRLGRLSGSHNIRQYAPHPKDGRGLLVRANKELILVEFQPVKEPN